MHEILDKYLKDIESSISEVHIPSTPKNLYDPIRYFLSLGGKRIRPVLCLMASEMFGGEKQSARHLALGIELFHNFTLIHDDIMDNAPLRRGKTTIHEKWDSNIAILCGDAVMIMAYQSLLRSNSDQLIHILDVFNKTALKVCEGQQNDMDFETLDDVKITQYLQMIEDKTSVLLGASLQIGGLSAGISLEESQKLYEMGRHMGIAFQLRDDWLDAFADPEKFGKIPGGDIRAGKKTYLILKTLELAGSEAENIRQAFIDDSIGDDAKVKEILRAFEQYKVEEHLNAEMEDHYKRSVNILNEIEGSEEVKKALFGLTESLMKRES